MSLVVYDRIQQTGTANTTVSFTLSATTTGYQSFAVVGNGNTTYYSANDGTNWEVGIGTYSTTGPTLTRTTILSSSNSGSAVTFSGTVTVFCDYPAEKAVYQDVNGNVLANNFIPAVTTTSSSSTPINLTVSSPQYQIVNGTTTSQVFNLPDATTLTVGDTFYFNNNITYSSVQINAHDGTTSILALQAGGAAHVILLTNGTSNGTWDVHSYIPSSVSWGNATLNFNNSSSISGSVTWQGNAVGVGYGGTGLTSLTSNYIPYGNGTSAFQSNSNFTFDGVTQTAPIQKASNGLILNSNTVSASYSIPSGYSAHSTGPMTVASGQSVTVPSGSRWVIL
jgi:hypothetical protein